MCEIGSSVTQLQHIKSRWVAGRVVGEDNMGRTIGPISGKRTSSLQQTT